MRTAEVSESQLLREIDERGWTDWEVITVPDTGFSPIDLGIDLWDALRKHYPDLVVEVEQKEWTVNGFGDVSGGEIYALTVNSVRYEYDHTLNVLPEGWLSIGCSECSGHKVLKILLGEIDAQNKCAWIESVESPCPYADDFMYCPYFWRDQRDFEYPIGIYLYPENF